MINPMHMEIINAGTRVYQDSSKISIQLPIINSLNEKNKNFFITKIKDMGLEIVSQNKNFILIEKIIKKRKEEGNLVFLTPRDKWRVNEKFLFSSSSDLLKFEAQIEELNQDMIQSIEIKVAKKEEMGKILIFPTNR